MRRDATCCAEEAKVLPSPADPQGSFRKLGERIVRFRQRRGWNRVNLAEQLGILRERLAKWELGKHPPPLEMLAPLAATLGVSMDELVTGKAPAGELLRPETESPRKAMKRVEDHEERIYDLLEELGERREGALLHLLECPGCQGFARKMLRPGPNRPT